jgi:hypothetical protein
MGLLKWDGINDYVLFDGASAALQAVPTAGQTLLMVIRRVNGAAQWNGLITLETSAAVAKNALEISGVGSNALSYDAGASAQGTATTAITDITDYHLVAGSHVSAGAITFTNKDITTGAAVARESPTSLANSASLGAGGLVRFGMWQTSDPAWVWGVVAAIWNVALTAAQVDECWANKRTSDLWNNSAGHPLVLVEFNSLTPVDLGGNCTFNQVNGPVLDAAETGAGWNFDGTGSVASTRSGILVPSSIMNRARWRQQPAIPRGRLELLLLANRRATPAGPGPQDVTTTSIPSSESWGTQTAAPGAVSTAPSSIPTSESWGSQVLQLNVSAQSIPSSESWGSSSVQPGPVNVSAQSIPSSESWGSQTAAPGPVNVSATSIGTSEAWGTASVTAGGASVALSAIGSSETWGGQALTPGPVNAAPSSIPSSESWGSQTVQPGPVSLALTGIGSSESWGATTVQAEPRLDPSSIGTSESWGTALISLGGVSLAPAGIGSSETWGATLVQAEPRLDPSSIGSSESWGNAALVPGPVTVAATGIPTSESWGALVAAPFVNVSPSSILTSESWGLQVARIALALPGIPSSESWGTFTVAVGAVTLQPGTIGSSEDWGVSLITTGFRVVQAGHFDPAWAGREEAPPGRFTLSGARPVID